MNLNGFNQYKRRKWTDEDYGLLKLEYATGNSKELEKVLDRKWITIQEIAVSLGLRRDCGTIKNTRKATNLEKRNVNFPTMSKEVIKKREESSLRNWGATHHTKNKEYKERIKQKNIERWGVDCPLNIEKNKIKIKEHWENQGVTCPSQLSLYKYKSYETKKKNNSFHKSGEENDLLVFICSIFPKTKYQYYEDSRYPFDCDYYIPELDLFIEYQGTWTHGGEPYNGSNLNPKWVERAIHGSRYYKNAVNVFTIRDPLKRETALKNNLNYLELWPQDYRKGFEHIKELIQSQCK